MNTNKVRQLARQIMNTDLKDVFLWCDVCGLLIIPGQERILQLAYFAWHTRVRRFWRSYTLCDECYSNLSSTDTPIEHCSWCGRGMITQKTLNKLDPHHAVKIESHANGTDNDIVVGGKLYSLHSSSINGRLRDLCDDVKSGCIEDALDSNVSHGWIAGVKLCFPSGTRHLDMYEHWRICLFDWHIPIIARTVRKTRTGIYANFVFPGGYNQLWWVRSATPTPEELDRGETDCGYIARRMSPERARKEYGYTTD